MTRPLIALDCDGVLADFVGCVVSFCNTKFGTSAKREDVVDWDIWKCLVGPLAEPAELEFVRAGCAAGFSGIFVLPGAVELVKDLRTFADIVIVTSPYTQIHGWEHARREWLSLNFGISAKDVLFVPGSRKYLINADLLIDDNAETCAEFPGPAILPARPYNTDYNLLRVRRVPDEKVALTAMSVLGCL